MISAFCIQLSCMFFSLADILGTIQGRIFWEMEFPASLLQCWGVLRKEWWYCLFDNDNLPLNSTLFFWGSIHTEMPFEAHAYLHTHPYPEVTLSVEPNGSTSEGLKKQMGSNSFCLNSWFTTCHFFHLFWKIVSLKVILHRFLMLENRKHPRSSYDLFFFSSVEMM